MNRPLIIAHRGASAEAPENTLAAFTRAFELGADGIELDVTLTKDNIPVVIHDDTVNRTTNARGVVSEMLLAEIKQLDAGSWKDAKYRGEKIPTLEETLRAIPTTKIVNIELKTLALRPWPANATRVRFADYVKISLQMLPRLWEPPRLEKEVAKVIEETDSLDRVIVSSFNPIALYRMRRLAPRVTRGLLYFKELPFFLGRMWLRSLARPHALHPRHDMIEEKYFRWASEKKYLLTTWTVDDPIEAQRLARLGVHAIITNQPGLLRKSLA